MNAIAAELTAGLDLASGTRLADPTTPLRALAAACGWKPPSEAVRKLRSLETQHRQALGRLEALGQGRVALLFAEAQERARRVIRTATDPAELETLKVPSKAELSLELANQRAAVKAGLRALTAEASALWRPVAENFLEVAEAHVAKLRTAESAVAAGYGLQHRDSSTVETLTRGLEAFRARLTSTFAGYEAPAAIAKPIFDL